MLTRGEERLIHGLRRRKVREREGLFLAEGVRVVEELLGAGIPIRVAAASPALEETDRGRELAAALGAATEVRRSDEGALRRLAATESPQGVIVVGEIPDLDATLDALEPTGPAAALVLDGVQDPGNAGTLIRTAAAFGPVPAVCLPGTVDPWNPKTVRATAGAGFRIPIRHASPDQLVAWAYDHDVALLGADVSGTPLNELRPPGAVALVVGNEGVGLSGAVEAALKARVAVPLRGPVESLNVGVAAAILLYLITEGR